MKSIVSSLLCSVALMLALGFASAEEESMHPAIAFSESKPVVIDGLEFTAVVEDEWKWPAYEQEVLVQLRISNKGSEDVVFRTFDSFGVSLVGADGKRMETMSSGRDATLITPDVVIRAGQSFTLSRKAVLAPDRTTGGPTFTYFDGTGSMATYLFRQPGEYQLKFAVGPPHFTSKPGGAGEGKRLWSGKGMTEGAAFRLVPKKEK